MYAPTFARERITDAKAGMKKEGAVASVPTRELFWGFLKIGLSGFGGVMPFAHRMLVERTRWLDEREFTEVLSLSQFLPGPNVVNLSVLVGRRFQGPIGAIAAATGLMLMPMVIVLLLATLLAEFAHLEAVRNACTGVSAAASGLILSVALKMARPIRGQPVELAIAACAFAGIGLLRFPMPWVLAVLIPISVAVAWRRQR